jgi:alanine racemase
VQPYPRTWVEIDLGTLGRNLGALRRRIGPEPKLALVCKADAYGHGLVPTARWAVHHGVDVLAVATVAEGIALREAGVESRVMVMSPTLAVEADQAVFYHLEVFCESVESARALSEAAVRQKRSIQIHLKVDTGLHRFGVTPGQALQIAQAISELPHVQFVGIASHFVDSGKNEEITNQQVEATHQLVREFREAGISTPEVQLANSAGAIRYPQARGDLVRIGIYAYGLDPYQLMEGELTPVLTWKARITSLRDVNSGDGLSYSWTHRTSRASRIATLGVGYGDGYPRALSNVGAVGLRGHKAPVVGLVMMDQTLIDVTDIPGVEIGEEVELVGRQVSAVWLAQQSGTNTHEIITRIMLRVNRRYLYPQ